MKQKTVYFANQIWSRFSESLLVKVEMPVVSPAAEESPADIVDKEEENDETQEQPCR